MAKLPVDENFAVQLAMRVPIDKMPLPAAGQLKYNGCRIVTEYNTRPVFKTRNSHPVSYPEMFSSACNLPSGYMYDGEWCIGDSKGTNHTAVSGHVNSAMKTNTSIPHLGWKYNLFDCMPLEHFYAKKCPLKYEERWNMLHRLVHSSNREDTRNIDVALTWHFTDHEAIEQKYNELIELGYEGMIIKAWDSLYTFKKNKTWMKLKAEEPADLKCIGWEEGKGKYTGMIGKLVCQGEVDGKFVTVGVATGMTDADRAKDPKEYIGKIIEIKYNEPCQDKRTGARSLFLPVFVIVREDKS